MISTKPFSISEDQFKRLIRESLDDSIEIMLHPEKHQLELWKDQISLGKIFLPWQLNWDEDEKKLFPKDDFHLALVMIRAGTAATGYYHNGELLDHKVFRAYMTRKKQGKSQIKYLKTKGKSRAGSRVRLEGTKIFFEEINERLQHYDQLYPISNWGISCAKTLWPFFFDANPSPPFESKQVNLLSIPFHISNPNYEALQVIGEKLKKIYLVLSEPGSEHFKESLELNPEEDKESEDW